ncbi:Smr/MutS family protein [Haliovirga abyssi]|uniref:Smr domain-containing protein n=1 Tax=Haliovirga abyssi TaxID=2996794 RepID=A0AAU9DCW5_9FUSO|nr:Smr/MutS family protein [Haliovirga abyssi]BDU51351.1 hypothetical protein HLVA_19200 [Haliovirga abyssi]
MRIIDMHELTVENAIDKFIQVYNENIGKSIKIIHGYGSSGKGGKIKKKLRQFLDENLKYLEYTIGEKIDGNRGYTIVNAKKRVPLKIDYIKIEILEFCNAAKTKEKIAGKFRKYEPEKILKALRQLEKSGELKVINKGKHKCYLKNYY